MSGKLIHINGIISAYFFAPARELPEKKQTKNAENLHVPPSEMNGLESWRRRRLNITLVGKYSPVMTLVSRLICMQRPLLRGFYSQPTLVATVPTRTRFSPGKA